MPLSAAQPLNIKRDGSRDDFEVLADTKLFKGGAVGITAAGYARPFQAGDFFGGHAMEEADNTGGANGDIRVYVVCGTYSRTVPVFASVTIANIGDTVDINGDDDASLAISGTSDINGVIQNVHDKGVDVVFRTFADKLSLEDTA